jgi:hypothetical protein
VIPSCSETVVISKATFRRTIVVATQIKNGLKGYRLLFDLSNLWDFAGFPGVMAVGSLERTAFLALFVAVSRRATPESFVSQGTAGPDYPAAHLNGEKPRYGMRTVVRIWNVELFART